MRPRDMLVGRVGNREASMHVVSEIASGYAVAFHYVSDDGWNTEVAQLHMEKVESTPKVRWHVKVNVGSVTALRGHLSDGCFRGTDLKAENTARKELLRNASEVEEPFAQPPAMRPRDMLVGRSGNREAICSQVPPAWLQ